MEEREVMENAEVETVESEALETAWKLFAADKKKNFVAVTVSPVVRVTLGESFGLAHGEDCIGKVAPILRALGADAVVDAAVAQDVVTLLQVKAMKAKKDGKPVLSSACRKLCSAENPVPNADEVGVRLVKKHYRAQNADKTVRVIAIVPCERAKKRVPGADVALSVEELTQLLESTVVNLRLVDKEAWDMPLGVASGAAYIAKTLGGEAEAVARCLLKDKSRMQLCKLIYSGLYGKGTRKVAEIFDGEKTWKFAVTADVAEAEKILAEQENGKVDYDFVELKPNGGSLCKVGMDGCADKEQTAKLRALGLRYLAQSRTAVSADVCPTAANLLRTWEMMVLSGEAFEENEPFVEETYEDEPVAEYVEEIVEEVLAETPVEETPVEETPVEEAPVEEVEAPVEEAPVEEVEEPVVEAPVEEVEVPVEEAPVEEVEAPVEETPVEEVEVPVEEAPVEEVEAPVEEAPVEEVEVPVEEAPVEEVEVPVEEMPVEETPVEEAPVEEVEVPVEEAPVEEVVEAVEETPIEEVEAPVEEAPVEEVVEPVEETPVEEEAPVEEVEVPVEETPVEEETDGNSPYSRRLSTRERRKLRNKKKNKK